jgi:PP-loop superfamily ATP-utilizing enzyme
MAKRKTPKAEKVIDLTPKAEKITDEQLKRVQETISNLNKTQMEVGQIETRKHELLHTVAVLNDGLTLIKSEFEKEYGTIDVNIQNGTINYPPDNGETDKKD